MKRTGMAVADKSRTFGTVARTGSTASHMLGWRVSRAVIGIVCVLVLIGWTLFIDIRDDLGPNLDQALFPPPVHDRRQETASTLGSRAKILQNYQVAQPVLMPEGTVGSDGSVFAIAGGSDLPQASCTVVLMEHRFGNSYGKPYIGKYTPPSCQFNRVIMNFTVTSQGRQFDRLAIMYFGDAEIWRTSTAEPTAIPGIRWTYLKDMTHFMYFWRTSQKIIFDLGNLVNKNYTGSFDTMLTATFFTSTVETDGLPASDLIVPISARKASSDQPSAFVVSQSKATDTVLLPRNARRAVLTVAACGQAAEEFWWGNVPQSQVFVFNDTTGPLPGYSPFREVQVLVDGQLAGVVWPFPVIFTGGVNPGLHRPIVGIEAFDLAETELDVTAFLPLLSDGQPHEFTLLVAGLDDSNGPDRLTGFVGDYWIVSANIFFWLDRDVHAITTGSLPAFRAADPTIATSVTLNRTAGSLYYTTSVHRALSVSAHVVTQDASFNATWTQTLAYSNSGTMSKNGNVSLTDAHTSGSHDATLDDASASRAQYAYPLWAEQSQDGPMLSTRVIQAKQLLVRGGVAASGLEAHGGLAVATAARVNTTKDGTALFRLGENTRLDSEVRQVFLFEGVGEDGVGAVLYSRDVTARNASVVADRETLQGVEWVSGGEAGNGGGLFAARGRRGGL